MRNDCAKDSGDGRSRQGGDRGGNIDYIGRKEEEEHKEAREEGEEKTAVFSTVVFVCCWPVDH